MPKFAANLSMLYTELPFLDRFKVAANAGFTGVEYLFPYAFPKEQVVEKLRASGLTQGAGIVDRLANPVLELSDTVGMAGDASLPFVPVAGRQVV